MGIKRVDLTGKRFGRWTVLEFSHIDQTRRSACWKCVCDCGNKGIVDGSTLRLLRSKSCGCLMKEVNAVQAKNLFTYHGHTKDYKVTEEYNTWVAMKRRCYDKSFISYIDYGYRGIRVCDKWLNSFENFLKDMGPRPSKMHSIDRINVNKDYEPWNCKWATRKEQSNNQRRSQRKAMDYFVSTWMEYLD